MNDYQRGYLDGYRERPIDNLPKPMIGEQEAKRLDQAEMMGAPSIEDEGGYWIGYYHGRAHRRTGQPPRGATGRVPAGL